MMIPAVSSPGMLSVIFRVKKRVFNMLVMYNECKQKFWLTLSSFTWSCIGFMFLMSQQLRCVELFLSFWRPRISTRHWKACPRWEPSSTKVFSSDDYTIISPIIPTNDHTEGSLYFRLVLHKQTPLQSDTVFRFSIWDVFRGSCG